MRLDCTDNVHAQDFSKGKTNELKEDLDFGQKIEVIGFDQIYNFQKENFFKF